jgi:hypothetical protein
VLVSTTVSAFTSSPSGKRGAGCTAVHLYHSGEEAVTRPLGGVRLAAAGVVLSVSEIHPETNFL